MTDSRSYRKRLSLPFELWPEADRNAWTAACQPAARLKRGGAAGHLSPASREVHERHYGNFLGFLDRNGLLRRDAPAAANVTPQNVDAYVAEAKACMSSTTVHVAMCCLRRAARYMIPGLELGWLNEIAKGPWSHSRAPSSIGSCCRNVSSKLAWRSSKKPKTRAT